MKHGILSVVLALCLCISSSSVAYAWQEEPQVQEDVFVEGDVSAPVTRDSVVPTPTEVYKAMTALKDQEAYREGTTWTNDEPYSDAKGYYHWNGGPLGGTNISAVGCVAFAFILSDAAFGGLPARMYEAGAFRFEDIKVGDILRVNGDAHTVIVLEVADVGVVVAEGNISTGDHKGKVHWGRGISKEDVMNSTSHYITRYPENYVSPDDPLAGQIIDNGFLDGGLAWNLAWGGTLTITGKGAMPDFNGIADQPWSDHSSRIRKVVIGDGVTSIGSCAFWNCGVLGAQISPSVTQIGNNAFYGSSIISLTIPSSVKTIGDNAFCECKNLSSVTVSEGVEIIGQNAFSTCTGLTSIALPASIREVGAAAFFQCTALTKATFAPGSGEVKLGDNLFTRCYYLMSVTLPKRIDRIGEGMFMNCMMLAGVEIPQGAECIGGSAFSSCSRLTTIVIPDSVSSIGAAAFGACPLQKIYFTGSKEQWEGISKMGDTASAVSKAEIQYNYTPPADPGDGGAGSGGGTGEGSGTGGGTGAGSGSDGSAGGGAGTGGGSDGSAGGGAGTGGGGGDTGGGSDGGAGTGGGSGDTGAGTEGDGNDGGGMGDGSGTDGSGGGDSQKPAPSQPAKGTVLKSGGNSYKVTKAGATVAFVKSSGKVSSVSVPATVKIDGISYKVTSIEAKAFLNNKKLTKVTMGKNVTSIGKNAFKGCIRLTTVTMGKNVTSIGDGAFSGCKKLTKITLDTKVKKIGKEAFKDCKNLGTITVKSKKITTVGKNAFKGIKSNAKIKVPASKYKAYQKLFKGKGQGKKVTIVKIK